MEELVVIIMQIGVLVGAIITLSFQQKQILRTSQKIEKGVKAKLKLFYIIKLKLFYIIQEKELLSGSSSAQPS